jgi:DNA-binding GntR family transcriptional regulator
VPLANARPLKKKSLSDEVYDELRQQIILGNLKSGERLDIFTIAEDLGVSRTPVKDAFNRLGLEGLVTIHPNRGTFVSSITAETIAHVFDVRLMIEMWAVRAAAADRSVLDLEAMTAILDRCERILDESGDFNWEEFVAADRDLHSLIVNGPRNPLLTRMYESVFPQIQFLRVYWTKTRERACVSHQEHLAILAALRSGSFSEVEEALRTHILSCGNHVLQMLGSAETELAGVSAEPHVRR